MTIVVQISRGLAPAVAIASVMLGASGHRWPYYLVTGLPAAAAKNEAVRLAYGAGANLVLVEDDVIVSWAKWPSRNDAIYAADVICRGGTLNTVRDSRGEVLYTGTCFVRVPWWALDRMGAATETLFQPWVFQQHSDRLHKIEPDPAGQHSDVYFYWLAREKGVPVRIFGTGSHLLHGASGGGQNVSEIQVA